MMKTTTKTISGLLFSLFLILGVIGCESSTITSPVEIPVTNQPPQAPSALVVEKVTKNTVTLKWTDQSDNENGFKVFRDGQLIASTDPNISIYWDNNLNPATRYQYTIKAFNQAGESDELTCTVKTLNPSIIITLNKIGVYDNGESFTRDNDGGEVYVYFVITDGDKVQEIRVPDREETFLKLKDNETIDIGMTIYMTNQVSDDLGIAVVGYESDGGDFEELVFQALGAAATAQVGGTDGLLGAFNLNLDSLIGSLLGAEDDCLGSHEFTWGPSKKWGLGNYEDIVCQEEDGKDGLRLWFAIESNDFMASTVETTSSPIHYEPLGEIILEDQIALDILNEAAFGTQYPNGMITQFPVNEDGIYCSDLIALEQNENILIALSSKSPIILDNSAKNPLDGLKAQLFRRIDSRTFSSSDVEILSNTTTQKGDQWELTAICSVKITGEYQVTLVNHNSKPTLGAVRVHKYE